MSVEFDRFTLDIMNGLPEREKYILADIIKNYAERATQAKENETFWVPVWEIEFGDDTNYNLIDYNLCPFDKKYECGATQAIYMNTDRFLPHFTKHDILLFKGGESEEGDYALVESKIDNKYYLVTHDHSFYETLDGNKIFLPCQVKSFAKVVKIIYDEDFVM